MLLSTVSSISYLGPEFLWVTLTGLFSIEADADAASATTTSTTSVVALDCNMIIVICLVCVFVPQTIGLIFSQ